LLEARNLIKGQLESVTSESERYQKELDQLKAHIIQNSSNQATLLKDIAELESKIEEGQEINKQLN